MPELPEVETVRRGLQPFMEGARITHVEQRRPDLRFPFPERFRQRLEDAGVDAVSRRAKYLLFHFDNGSSLISHLGMSGSYRIEPGENPSNTPGRFHQDRSMARKHDHVVFHLEVESGDTSRIVYNDPRRFGFMLLTETAALESHPMLTDLGIEPTGNSLDGALLSKLFSGKQTPLKSALLDQKLIAGLGNIYVCEALWRAGLSPRRLAGSIARSDGRTSARAGRLADAVRSVIADAIEAGGSSLRDYVHTDGSLGYFQHSFATYDQEGKPCARCKTEIQRIVQSGRSTFFCPSCQR